jgi:hypothetical protein
MNPHLNEGDPAPDDLTPIWRETNLTYRAITEHQPAYRCIRWLMEHILDAGYSKGLFPGTSMYSLLISIPLERKVNYRHTLHIGYDELRQEVKLNMKCRPNEQRSTKDLKEEIKWSTTCQPTELIDTFEHFLNDHPDWSRAARSN